MDRRLSPVRAMARYLAAGRAETLDRLPRMIHRHTIALVVGWAAAASVWALPGPVRAGTARDDRVSIEIIGAQKGAGPQDPFGARVHLAAMRAASWLARNQKADGRFLYRLFTAVNRVDQQDSYLRQAGSAYAVARAARYSGNARYSVSATSAIRALLRLTQWDGRRRVLSAVPRRSIGPDGQLGPGHVLGASNRLGGSALLLLAMSELVDPSEFSREMVGLSRFLESRQNPEGWLRVSDISRSPVRQSLFPGEALLALIRAYKHTKRDQSLQAVMRALPWYRQYWQNPGSRCTEYFAWQCSAFAEAYLVTRDPACVAYVCSLVDWMLPLQYEAGKAPSDWVGGFARYSPVSVRGGRVVPAQMVPRIPRNNTGSYAEGLADACRLAQAAGDAARLGRYKAALKAALTFLMGLQYTEANGGHFSARYMPLVYGAVRESLYEGDIRCDYAQHATCAWLQYLIHMHQADAPAAR